MTFDPSANARAMLFGGEEPPSKEIAPHRTAAAQAWAMLAVAQALEELALAVEGIRADMQAERGN